MTTRRNDPMEFVQVDEFIERYGRPEDDERDALAVEDAVALVQQLLANGPMPRTRLHEALDERGISDRTWGEVKQRLRFFCTWNDGVQLLSLSPPAGDEPYSCSALPDDSDLEVGPPTRTVEELDAQWKANGMADDERAKRIAEVKQLGLLDPPPLRVRLTIGAATAYLREALGEYPPDAVEAMLKSLAGGRDEAAPLVTCAELERVVDAVDRVARGERAPADEALIRGLIKEHELAREQKIGGIGIIEGAGADEARAKSARGSSLADRGVAARAVAVPRGWGVPCREVDGAAGDGGERRLGPGLPPAASREPGPRSSSWRPRTIPSWSASGSTSPGERSWSRSRSPATPTRPAP